MQFGTVLIGNNIAACRLKGEVRFEQGPFRSK